MYAIGGCDVRIVMYACDRWPRRQVRCMPTTGTMYANSRNHNEDNEVEVDGDKLQSLLTTR